MNKKNLSNSIKELHGLYQYINTNKFGGKLPEVIITIQSKGKTNALGWFSVDKVWEHGEERKHEINISAESINRGFIEVARTLWHEMIHLYCSENNIKDCSRGGSYHNKKFKQVSEQYGFYYEEDAYSDKYGWTFSKLTAESIDFLNKYNIDGDIFAINRMGSYLGDEDKEKKKKSNSIKWICGCGNIVRSTKDNLRIICADCETMFMKEEEMEEFEN